MLSTTQTEDLQALNLQTFAGSQMFQHIFDEGMCLVDETASYLDGPGRAEQRQLSRKCALTYAGESMRVTTRLMQAASWLLVQRAVHDGEMAPEEAARERYRLGSRDVCNGSPREGVEDLPEKLRTLLDRSEALYCRIARLDEALFGRPGAVRGARARMAMLERAFSDKCA